MTLRLAFLLAFIGAAADQTLPAPADSARPDSLILTTPYSAPDTATPAPPPLPPEPEVVDLSHHTVILSVDDGYHSVFTNIYPLLRKYRMSITLGVIADYVGPGRPSYRASDRFMNQAEIQELLDSCDIEIASHSLSHAFLTRLDSAAAWKEIRQSKVVLESLFDTEVVTFVYPYGDMNALVRRMVRRAGYRMGRAVRPGTPNLWVDPYRIPELELRQGVQLAAIQRHIRRHATTVLLIHQVVDSPAVFTQWPRKDFTLLLDWLYRNQAKVTTLAGLYQEWWFRRLAKLLDDVTAAFPDRRKQLLFEDVDVDATQAPHPR